MLEVGTVADTLEAMAVAGGGTLDLTTGTAATRESGYYVGGAHGMAAVMIPVDAPADWHAVLDTVRAAGSAYVGVWENAGLYYVDATEWHATEWDALEAGRARGEIAVWDISKEAEITC